MWYGRHTGNQIVVKSLDVEVHSDRHQLSKAVVDQVGMYVYVQLTCLCLCLHLCVCLC